MERPECTVCLRGTPRPYLFIDLDLCGAPLGPNDVRCDFLAFVDDVKGMPCVAPVEFKSRWRRKMVEQLQSGAKEAEKHVPTEFEYQFRPTGVLKSFPKAQRKKVRQHVLSFRDQFEHIRIIVCGDKFIDALQSIVLDKLRRQGNHRPE